MGTPKSVLLCLNSNIEAYRVCVYDENGRIQKQITTKQGCLCFRTCSPCIRVVATPLVDGYSTILYYWIGTTCQPISLYFNFPSAQPPTPLSVNTFTLTDRNYGLLIDGSLLFTAR